MIVNVTFPFENGPDAFERTRHEKFLKYENLMNEIYHGAGLTESQLSQSLSVPLGLGTHATTEETFQQNLQSTYT